jgi:hypothetical protein
MKNKSLGLAALAVTVAVKRQRRSSRELPGAKAPKPRTQNYNARRWLKSSTENH